MNAFGAVFLLGLVATGRLFSKFIIYVKNSFRFASLEEIINIRRLLFGRNKVLKLAL